MEYLEGLFLKGLIDMFYWIMGQVIDSFCNNIMHRGRGRGSLHAIPSQLANINNAVSSIQSNLLI